MITEKYNSADTIYIAIIASILLVVDSIWLYLIQDTFGKLISKIQKSSVKIRHLPAFGTYIIMTLGLYHFIIKEKRSPLDAVMLGYFAYGIYEGTNYTTFKEWDLITSIRDILWGGSLFGFTTFFFYIIYNKINEGKDKINV